MAFLTLASEVWSWAAILAAVRSSGAEGMAAIVHDAAVSESGVGACRDTGLGADGIHWLVLARHPIVTSEETIAQARQVMEDAARRHRGEYDGWEAEVTQARA